MVTIENKIKFCFVWPISIIRNKRVIKEQNKNPFTIKFQYNKQFMKQNKKKPEKTIQIGRFNEANKTKNQNEINFPSILSSKWTLLLL